MTLLINRNDIADYKQISKTADATSINVLNQFILDAQFSDLQSLMGGDFYNDLIRNYTDANYVTLLNGGDYTYSGTTYTNHGLKAVIVHYAYSRYVLFGSQIDTPFSLVEKLNGNDSKQVSTDAKKTTAKMAEQLAFNYWENVQLFLERNSNDYPLYKSECVNRKKTFRFSKIG